MKLTPSELATEFQSSQSTVSEHITVLRRAGLITYSESRGRRLYRIQLDLCKQVIDQPVLQTA